MNSQIKNTKWTKSKGSTSSRKLAALVDASKGKIVSIEFIKKDGSIRTLVGRTGVKKYLKGGKSSVDQSKFISIWDIQNHGYRSINRDSIVSVRTSGIEAYAI